MIARLLRPLPVAIAALLLAAAVGPAWFLLKTDVIVTRVLAARRDHAAAEAEKQGVRRAQGWDFWTIEMENLTNELKGEKARLRKESDQLDQRSARLAAERQEMDRIRLEVESMRREIDNRVIAIRADEAHNLRALAQTYATLTPAGAVAILREMDDATVVKILSLMKADIVGPIFEAMVKTPTSDGTLAKRAGVLSEKLRLMKAGVQPSAK